MLLFCWLFVFRSFYRLSSWTSFLHPTAIWFLWLCRASADSRWWSCWYKATIGPDSMFRSYRCCLLKMLCKFFLQYLLVRDVSPIFYWGLMWTIMFRTCFPTKTQQLFMWLKQLTGGGNRPDVCCTSPCRSLQCQCTMSRWAKSFALRCCWNWLLWTYGGQIVVTWLEKNGQIRRKDIHYLHGYPFLWIIHHKLSLGIWISVGFRRKVASLPSVERFALGFATSTQLRLCSRADQKQQDRDGLTPLDYLKSQGVNVTWRSST